MEKLEKEDKVEEVGEVGKCQILTLPSFPSRVPIRHWRPAVGHNGGGQMRQR
jgi:hypothetical protein